MLLTDTQTNKQTNKQSENITSLTEVIILALGISVKIPEIYRPTQSTENRRFRTPHCVSRALWGGGDGANIYINLILTVESLGYIYAGDCTGL